MAKLAIVCTHPIQYYSPWFRHLAEQGESLSKSLSLSKAQPSSFSFEAFYAHKQTAKGQADAGFGVEFELFYKLFLVLYKKNTNKSDDY